tara:strand:+ start:2081 stop:2953 length:873 start_codon:yes stop_codon:yes gene_type:complete
MIPTEIFKKIRLIELKTKNIVNNIMGGEYHSAFKGSGVEFSELREYIHGDDIRRIDWNVTAKTNKPYIKRYNEERQLTVILAIDISASSYFGTKNTLKSDIMIEIASVISFSAISNNDKVGLLLFSNTIEKFIPPQKGRKHVLRVIRELLYYKPKKKRTNINIGIDHLLKIMKRKSIVFLISDFWDDSFYKSMKIINQKHDLVNIAIHDSAEKNFPDLGLIKLEDVETKNTYWIDSNAQNYHKINNNFKSHLNDFTDYCKKNKIDLIKIDSEIGYIDPLVKFFNTRSNKY